MGHLHRSGPITHTPRPSRPFACPTDHTNRHLLLRPPPVARSCLFATDDACSKRTSHDPRCCPTHPLENPGVPPPSGILSRAANAPQSRARASSSREESRTEDDGRRARRDSAFARVSSRRETTDGRTRARGRASARGRRPARGGRRTTETRVSCRPFERS